MTVFRPRLCFVVQRYGRDVAGGAETLCREVAHRLSRRYRITVLTTCALDYLTWRNHYPPGRTADGDVEVVRFPVVRERRVRSFGRRSVRLYRRPHRVSEEVAWMELQGPDAPGLLEEVASRREDFDLFLFFTYLYPPTFFGLPKVASRAVLVPMAHPEEPLGLEIFRWLFHLPRGFIFNTPEERDLVHRTFACRDIPFTVAGVGIDPPSTVPSPARRAAPYLLYAGRIDVQKGVGELLEFFGGYAARHPGRVELVLVGERKMPLPRRPGITWLGYVPEEEKHALLAGAAAVVVPSPHESLSITALEAWAHGRPVLANGRSDVLAGQCRRSLGGLVYADRAGFESALDTVLEGPAVEELGRRGREFVAREYRWEVIDERYTSFLDALLERIDADRHD